MIHDIFLPEKIGEYYIFYQRIVGIDITKSHLHATLLVQKGTTTKIEKVISEPLNSDVQNHDDRIIAQLPSVMKAIGRVNHIRTAIPSTHVVFKELRLPFISHDKISMVIRFEVEPLLPFPAQEAVIDFIITDINNEEKTAQVLVAAVQKQQIAHHLSLYEQAGIRPTAITVDMFALYGLYTQIPEYSTLEGAVIVLDLDMHNTRIVAIDNKKLRIIRTLSYGIASIAKDAGNAAHTKPAAFIDQLVRFGIDEEMKSDKNKALYNSLSSYFNKIQFAVNSTISTLQSKNISKVLLVGTGANIKNISAFASDLLQISCNLFDIQLITSNKQYRVAKKASLSTANIMSVAIGLLCPATEHFNLEKEEFAPPQTRLLLKQVIIASLLIITLFGSLVSHSIIQSHRLKNEIASSQLEAVDALRERFTEIPEDEDVLDDIVDLAKKELAKEEDIWLAFSSQARASFLEYLLELSTRINKQQLGFIPEELTITDGVIGEITLKAQVRDFEALKQLEQVLRQSKLFSYVEGQTTTDFTMKITIAQNR